MTVETQDFELGCICGHFYAETFEMPTAYMTFKTRMMKSKCPKCGASAKKAMLLSEEFIIEEIARPASNTRH